ncbi:MAG: DUF742 domain-containing protein, partial [Sporichthyaceae bacterium]|nr:DUF742 domain-containing protein [Sporichthyaceae bacterium]
GGRARPGRADLELELEALVVTSWLSELSLANANPSPEQREILRLCRDQAQSIAEIAALLVLPLGVVRVLVGDLADNGLVELHRPAVTSADDRPNRSLLERVLDGLRRI